jgi:hypothetical protein
MAGLASINIKFKADLTGFSSEMQNSLRQIDAAGQKFQKLGRSMSAFVTLPILAAGAAAVKFASDYNESLNKVDVSFKDSSVNVKEFAKTTLESFGIAEGTALDMAAAYGDMGGSMGLTTNEAAKMSTSLVGLAGDLASFKNISIDIANTAIASIFTGETESLKKMGIVMTEVNLKQFALNSGITKMYEQMSQAEKVQLRYNYVLSVTKNAQGDFARTSGGAANQMRIFQESLKQIAAQMGEVVLPLFTKIITAINEKVVAFSKLSQGTKQTIVIIAGLVAVVGPLLLAFGAILSIIPAIVAGFALISGAIIPVLAGITLLYGAYLILKPAADKATKAVTELTSAQKLSQRVMDEATGSIVDQKSQLESLLLTARNENESKEARFKAIQAINKISPEYLGNLTLENINTDKARISVEKYNTALIAGATARAASRLLEQNQTDKIKAGFEREKALADYNEKRKNAIAGGWEAEKQFYEENNRLMQFANEALDRKNAKYDSEAKLLTEIYNKNKDNLKLLDTGKPLANVAAPVKEKKRKAPENVDAIESTLKTPISSGSIESYDAEIAKIKEFRDQVATTAEQILAADNTIAGIELAKALNFDPSSVIKSVETTEEMMKRLAAAVSGAKAELEPVMIDITDMITGAVQSLAANMAAGLGEAIGGLISGTQNIGGILSGMLGLIANFMGDLGKQLIAVGVASIAFKKAFANPFVAVAAGVALVALSSIFSNTLKAGPKTQAFANGGIVGGSSYYGDKILARVNSGELVLNSDQQSKLYGQMNSGGGGDTIIPSLKISGSDLLVVFNRANNRKNRIG